MEPVVPPIDNPELPPKKNKNKAGRPPKDFSPEDREKVTNMAKLGIQQSKIAGTFGKSAKTLRKHCSKELAEGALEADVKVLDSLYDMAKSKRNPACTIFWAKTRCGYRYSGLVTEDDKQTAPLKTPESPKAADSSDGDSSDLVVFSVYNNDGEPNADY